MRSSGNLNAEHTQQFKDALARYATTARRVGASCRQQTRSRRKAAASAPPHTTEVREWAKTQGIDAKDRGRIPVELIVKFKAATGQ